jgi:hypothetical protein
MSLGKNLVVIAVIGVALIGGLAFVYMMWRGGESTPPMIEPLPPPPIGRQPTPTPLVEEVTALLTGVTLATSDEVVRELARGLTSHPKLAVWLANEDLIRRVVAAVESIANGKSPRTSLEFLRPEGKFKVIERRGDFVVDPSSYERYNLVTAFLTSLDSEGLVVAYDQLKPLVNQAYAEIAPPGKRFDTTLIQAIDELLKVPVVDHEIYLQEKVITYTMIDEDLEGLSEAQRHLLRMGPENIKLIKEKLRELAKALRSKPGPRSESSSPKV